MIKWVHLCIIFCWLNLVSGQNDILDNTTIENLKKQLASPMDDVSKADLLGRLSEAYMWFLADSGLWYADLGLQISKRIKYNYGEAVCSINLCVCLIQKGNFTNALEYGYKALAIFENLQDTKNRKFSHGILMICYRDQGDYQQALIQGYKAKEIGLVSLGDSVNIFANISSVYEKSNKLDSALFYGLEVYKLNEQYIGELITLGNIYLKMGDPKVALNYYKKGVGRAVGWGLMDLYLGISKALESTHEVDSSISNAQKSFIVGKVIGNPLGMHEASRQLAHLFELRSQSDSVVKYLKLSVSLNDSLFNNQKVREAQNFAFNEKLHQQNLEKQQLQFENQFKIYGLLSILLFLLFMAFVQYRNNKRKQETNIQLLQQKEKVESTLGELKSTQSQLIQSEKMASLGELTAGIAHEIQNPLNFVNNFSEVNKELLDEIQEERKKEKEERNEILESELISNIKENEDKINYHGRRADAIVKSMLQHSRNATGQKELTDLNALCDEYLRLSYHGLKAKDKTFKAEFTTDLDPNLPKIAVVPQEIGRVLLNLFNNAFYAVGERMRSGSPDRSLETLTTKSNALRGGAAYKPTVKVSTKWVKAGPGGLAEIRIEDNGLGIPEEIREKIFQPFYTTKPTGEGTGLGLSLAYDIVKAHGGTITVSSFNGPPGGVPIAIGIKVESRESEARLSRYSSGGLVGQGTEFIIQLPV